MSDSPTPGRNPDIHPDSPPRPPGRGSGGPAWWAAGLLLVAAAVAAACWLARAGAMVQVTVDGYVEAVHTTQPTVGKLLTDLGLTLRPEDRLEPSFDTAIAPGLTISVQRARPVVISADGGVRLFHSHATRVGGLLAEADVRLGAHDEVWLDGSQVALGGQDGRGGPAPAGDALPPADGPRGAPRYALGRAWAGHEPAEVRLTIRRAVPITVDDGSIPFTIRTTAQTVGEALLREQMTLYLGDRVSPSLGSPVRAGMRVSIERSKSVLVTADRRTVHTRTRGDTVGDTLIELGFVVSGSDRVTPALSRPVLDNTQIRLTRVLETTVVERSPIPFESVLVPDDALEIDLQRLDQKGEDGEYRRRFKVIFEDGVEASRTLTDDWIAAQPITQVVAYGRQIISRPLETQEGTFSYWRKVRMLATSYSASTAGVSPDKSWYGITRLGWVMRKGIVAVDPTVVVLGSKVYVPGYGLGDVGDTGSAIRNRRIDLGYDDHNLVLWYRWVDVYLLDPPPPVWEIRWVLPNWPRE